VETVFIHSPPDDLVSNHVDMQVLGVGDGWWWRGAVRAPFPPVFLLIWCVLQWSCSALRHCDALELVNFIFAYGSLNCI
jgi:hypothetical protein